MDHIKHKESELGRCGAEACGNTACGYNFSVVDAVDSYGALQSVAGKAEAQNHKRIPKLGRGGALPQSQAVLKKEGAALAAAGG